MMGAQDMPSGQRSSKSAEGQFDGQIDRLNKEWREKRNSYRSAHPSRGSTPIPGDDPLDGVGALATLPGSQRTETIVDHGLNAAAFSGSIGECMRILDSNITGPLTWGTDGTTPLFSAALGGHADVVRLLLEKTVNPGQQNRNRQRQTALHAAALKGHGKICMILLESRADPLVQDANGVAPMHYASCSEALWPHFAAVGCARATKEDLIAKGIIRKASTTLEHQLYSEPNSGGVLHDFSRPGSAYVASARYPPRPGSAVSFSSSAGANDRLGTNSRPASRSGKFPISPPIDILAEGGDAMDDKNAKNGGGLQSLGL